MDTAMWRFLVIGFVFTVAIETPVLLLGLSRRHTLSTRLLAALGLTAFTYPIVVLVIPAFLSPVDSRLAYLAVAELFAPVAECWLFYAAFMPADATRRQRLRDFLAIVLANLLSFATGELLYALSWQPV